MPWILLWLILNVLKLRILNLFFSTRFTDNVDTAFHQFFFSGILSSGQANKPSDATLETVTSLSSGSVQVSSQNGAASKIYLLDGLTTSSASPETIRWLYPPLLPTCASPYRFDFSKSSDSPLSTSNKATFSSYFYSDFILHFRSFE